MALTASTELDPWTSARLAQGTGVFFFLRGAVNEPSAFFAVDFLCAFLVFSVDRGDEEDKEEDEDEEDEVVVVVVVVRRRRSRLPLILNSL